MSDDGWRPLRPSRRPDQDGSSFVVSPFVRLARVHALAAASDASLAVALAGSIFFSISPDAARWRVALYLALTMAPFAVVTPLIGPVIDRLASGRKAMIVATTAGRMVVAYFMIEHIDTFWLFPLAFSFLVLQRGYAVAKSAVVPRFVQSETDLVDANSRLALISAVVSLVGAAIGGGFSLIGGSSWAAAVGMVGFGVATVMAFRLPGVKVATSPAEALERAELRGRTILLAGSAMAVLRGAVGFVTFMLAFEFRGGEESLDTSAHGAAVGGLTATARGVDITGDPAAPVWHFGLVIVAAAAGALLGARLAPRLRTRLSEETMMVGVLGVSTGGALLSAVLGGLAGAILLALVISAGAGAGKLAFDALVQRDAPDANYGRSFARFEARFQITWVIGAFVPTVVPLGISVGSGLVAVAVAFALVSYLLGRSGREPLRLPRVRRGPRSGSAAASDQPEPAEDGVEISDQTAEMGTDATTPLTPPPRTDASSESSERVPDPPPAPWWTPSATPNVSSVDGVEVDDDPSRSSLPPIDGLGRPVRRDEEQ